MTLEKCLGCGGRLPDVDGPVHRYMESSPGCWAAFGEVLAREYSDPTLMEVHRLSVDAYAVQHPGSPSPKSTCSVGVHLIRLCLFLEHELSPEDANGAMLKAAKRKHEFVWSEPPETLGQLSIADVLGASTTHAHRTAVREWARGAWEAWSPHHEIVRSWLPEQSA